MTTSIKIAAAFLLVVGVILMTAVREAAVEPEIATTIPPATDTIDDRVDRINAFFEKRNMPLAGYGAKFVIEAKKNDIDWRLLPALSVIESSGGKQTCSHNPFGWASCRKDFESIDAAIEYVSWNLGGNNPNTRTYYEGDTADKLWSYNGTVNPNYPGIVLGIMEQF